ncbi:hypothetical protein EV363DRAFT_1467263 [Boletus edulis]|uniref:RING-type E3 ubiquitin transferase n=1 Tax=Boletus edulis BED1 TaxID=1328754 RepID=A0AAD4C4R2_BOLED|nr:hypothetical protein EV363DRAFT_1467263 [Boletus edulis]KAF8449061.1 hypothetical protein L210DRAFT_847484 [Boletus edulis BED1]
MDRPVTSKSRGICRYYTTPRGCFAGDDCKFLHGADEKLTPYDKAKVCRYYARGHCSRGDQCWFRHHLPKVALDDERIQFNAEACCICLEKPTTYGLLTDCSHIFCLECIRQWRSPAGKGPDVVSSGTIKCCPLCRTPSRFVTPSAHFFANGPRKKETIDAYKASMARIACKYFDETSRTGKPCCPFGTDCFYRHTNSDGTLHVFHHGAKHSMNVYRRHRLRGASFPPARFDYDDPIEFLQHIFENPITNLHATLDVIRASLPALMEGLASSNEPWNSDSGEDEEIAGGSTDPPEPLVRTSFLHPHLYHEAPCRCSSNFSPLVTMLRTTTKLRRAIWLRTTKRHPPLPLLRRETMRSLHQRSHSWNIYRYRRRRLYQKCILLLSPSLHPRRGSAR